MDTSNANASEDESFYGVFVETEADESGNCQMTRFSLARFTQYKNKIMTFHIQKKPIIWFSILNKAKFI